MTPFVLIIGLFATWWLIGLAVFAVVGVATSDLRTALTAPALGSATMVIPLFILSNAGIPMDRGAIPAVIVLVIASLAILIARRSAPQRGVWPIIAFCVLDLLLIGRPFIQFGFGWIADANEDMSNYVLSATDLLHHGLIGPVDLTGLREGRDYASLLRELHNSGSRPGADITLAAFSELARRPPYELFMPLILSMNLCAICGTGALAMQATRRRWAASVAAILLMVSPLAAFGVLQQLMPQVWGLAIATSLFALLMRPDLHTSPGATRRELVPIAILAAAFVVVYVELVAAVAGAYLLYVGLLVVRRRATWSAVLRLWGAIVIVTALVVNTYLWREVPYVASQTSVGASQGLSGSLFGYVLVPAELPAILGLQAQDISATHLLSASIFVAIVLLATFAGATVLSAYRGVGASCVLTTYLVLGLFLATRSAGFGLFKLFMYVQPFLAAAIAVWLATIDRRRVLGVVGVLGIVLVGAQIRTEARYVTRSLNPVDLTHASSPGLLPTFRRWFASTSEPVISGADNPVLAKMEAASVGSKPLYFIANNFFANFVGSSPVPGWSTASMPTGLDTSPTRDTFPLNPDVDALVSSGRCLIVLPTGSETILNRRSLPEGSVDLSERQCRAGQNILLFTASSIGQGFYLPENRSRVSFYQLQPDYFYPGRTFAGFGQFALLRILDPTRTVRLELWVTTTLFQSGSNEIPPATITGAERANLPIVGRGSARVFSTPLRPEIINGQAFVLFNMGVRGRVLVGARPGLQGIYGSTIPLDPRYLTSYVRDISLVTNAEYQHLRAPNEVRGFPAGLAAPNLEYSGIYEDGWIAGDSYVVLGSGPAGYLSIQADALRLKDQHLEVIVDGRELVSRNVAGGLVNIHVPVAASASRRHVELRWGRIAQLGPKDHRKAAARLEFVGVGEPPAVLNDVPEDLANPNLVYSGIFPDGWVGKDGEVVLAPGPAANLVLRADVLALVPGEAQHLKVVLNGRGVWSANVTAGLLTLKVRAPASRVDRHVQLRWAGVTEIAPNDPRHAAALLKFVGLEPASQSP